MLFLFFFFSPTLASMFPSSVSLCAESSFIASCAPKACIAGSDEVHLSCEAAWVKTNVVPAEALTNMFAICINGLLERERGGTLRTLWP